MTFIGSASPVLRTPTGEVARIFQNSFTPRHSHAQNNWRDFFRYGLGVGCLASETELGSSFLWEHRSECQYLTRNNQADLGCQLHPLITKYIRGLDKPKLLQWNLNGAKGLCVDLNEPHLLEVLRPLAMRVPLEPLIVALYFGSTWSNLREVSVERFASDFHFEDVNQVEYLFAVEIDDPATLEKIAAAKQEMISATETDPFNLTGDSRTAVSTVVRKIRTRAFMEAVRDAYDRSCAVCGLRVDAPDGKWEVQAAHIYPRELSGIDDIRNGVALCHNHHWAFDQFMFTIDKQYSIEWQSRARGHSICIEGKLRLPSKREQWPNQNKALEWHRNNSLKKADTTRS